MKKEQTQIMRLESVLMSEKARVVINEEVDGIKHATRVTKDKRKDKTHALRLQSNVLRWANNKNGAWEHKFESPEQAAAWWNHMVVSRSGQNN